MAQLDEHEARNRGADADPRRAGEQRTMLERANLEVAAATGIAPPRLRIPAGTRTENVWVTPRFVLAGEHVLTYPAFALAHHDQATMIGVLAHEHQHVAHRDVAGQRAWSAAGRLALVGLVTAAGLFVAPAFVVAWVERATGSLVVTLGAALAFYAVVVAAILRLLPQVVPFTARSAADRRFRELRADLAAVQVVGAVPVLAMLEDLLELESSRQSAPSWLARLWHSRPATHPSTQDRMEAVRSYNVKTDPDAAARAGLAPYGDRLA